ncbi:MAG: type II secretion system secretin GspD [Pseudomonadota bacterium]|nr:type II secretion system secretin GspD [Pseudomonadota bacterium]
MHQSRQLPVPLQRTKCLLAVLLPALLLLAAPAWAEGGGKLTLNLKDANIRTLIETVSEATGKNFVIDPRVKAKVTVVSAEPMNQSELYQVFLSILQVHGYSAVAVGDVIKIVPDVNAKQGPVDVVGEDSTLSGDQLVTRVVRVENVPAAQLVPILRPLIPQQGHLAAYTASNALVISDRAGNIDRLLQIIKRIDVPYNQEIEFIPLKHASASDVVQIIGNLNKKDAKGRGTPGQPLLTADDRTNSILLGGDRSARLRIRGLIAHLDSPLEGGGNTQVVFLKHATAEDLAPILLGVGKQQLKAEKSSAPTASTSKTRSTSRSTSGTRDDIDVQADPTNNALIITASPAQFMRLKRVIDQLDVRRAQVLVESIIAEVNTDQKRELGFEFAVLPTDGAGPAGLSNLGGTSSLVNLFQNPFGVGAGLLLGGANLSGGTKWAFLLRALDGDAATNILSTPTLVTMDNEEAQIVVGRNVPFITGSFTQAGTAGATNPFQTIEREDVGITLNITPHINEGDTVRLEIEQEASNISTTSLAEPASDIITDKRSIKTNVVVENDAILVLGGLMEDQFRDTQQKVPGLSEIPLFGRLFRFDSTEKEKKNLMIFIHPVIMRNEDIQTHLTRRKYGVMRAEQIEVDMDDRGLFPDGVKNLPDIDELITRSPERDQTEVTGRDPDEFLNLY